MYEIKDGIIYGSHNNYACVSINPLYQICASIDDNQYLTLTFLQRTVPNYFIQQKLNSKIDFIFWLNVNLLGICKQDKKLHLWKILIDSGSISSYRSVQLTGLNGHIQSLSEINSTSNEISANIFVLSNDNAQLFLVDISIIDFNADKIKCNPLSFDESIKWNGPIKLKLFNFNKSLLIFNRQTIWCLFDIKRDRFQPIVMQIDDIYSLSSSLLAAEITDIFIDTANMTFTVAMDNGNYITLELRYNQSASLDNMELTWKTIHFPYGPFPCTSIPKIISGRMKRYKEDLTIFTGGLPSVYYSDVNCLSICRNGESEVCFIFPLPIIDFNVIYSMDNYQLYIEKIVVICTNEIIVIAPNVVTGCWSWTLLFPASSLADGSINQITRSIEISIGLNDESMCVFASLHTNGSIKLWKYYNRDFKILDEINIHDLTNPSGCSYEKSANDILWPRFIKCGRWPIKIQSNQIADVDLNISMELSNQILQILVLQRSSQQVYRFHMDLSCMAKPRVVCLPVDQYEIRPNSIQHQLIQYKQKLNSIVHLMDVLKLIDFSRLIKSLQSNQLLFINQSTSSTTRGAGFCSIVVMHNYDVLIVANLQLLSVSIIDPKSSQLNSNLKTSAIFKNLFNSSNDGRQAHNRTSQLDQRQISTLALLDVKYNRTDAVVCLNDGLMIVYELYTDQLITVDQLKYVKRLINKSTNTVIVDIDVVLSEHQQSNESSPSTPLSGTISRKSSHSSSPNGTTSIYNNSSSPSSIIRFLADQSNRSNKKYFILLTNQNSIKLLRHSNLKCKSKFKLDEYLYEAQTINSTNQSNNSNTTHIPSINRVQLCTHTNVGIFGLTNDVILILSISKLVVLHKILFVNISTNNQWLLMDSQTYVTIFLNYLHSQFSLDFSNTQSLQLNSIKHKQKLFERLQESFKSSSNYELN